MMGSYFPFVHTTDFILLRLLFSSNDFNVKYTLVLVPVYRLWVKHIFKKAHILSYSIA